MGAPGGLRNIGSPDRELQEPAPRVRPGAEGPGPRAGPGAGGHRVRGEEARTPHARQKSLRSQSPSVQLHTRCLAHTRGPRSTHHITGHVVFPALGVPPPRLPGPQLAVLGPGAAHHLTHLLRCWTALRAKPGPAGFATVPSILPRLAGSSPTPQPLLVPSLGPC